MKVGDIVRQRYQSGAGRRLVLGFGPALGTFICYDTQEDRFMAGHTWSHDVIEEATPETIRSAQFYMRNPAVQQELARWFWAELPSGT